MACKEHAELAREVAEKSVVLIKNTNGVCRLAKASGVSWLSGI